MPRKAASQYYQEHSKQLKRELAAELPRENLRALYRRKPWKHFMVTVWQFGLLGTASVALWQGRLSWLWVPAALVQGVTVFNFTVMLHEVVHRTVFERPHRVVYSLLGFLYAIPAGLSPTQFTRWHLDHHAALGSKDEDPKRHRLSPPRNYRWLKLLYFTPALFFTYFRAAGKETATYEVPLRRMIRLERTAALFVHLSVAIALALLGGIGVLARVYLVPLLFVFPIAFAVNRLGQHYDIDPEKVAAWSTRMKRSRFWEMVFLWSHYHLEHHDFPGVPFYNLRKLNALLSSFLDRRGIKEQQFGKLLYLYLVRNKTPHTNWDLA